VILLQNHFKVALMGQAYRSWVVFWHS